MKRSTLVGLLALGFLMVPAAPARAGQYFGWDELQRTDTGLPNRAPGWARTNLRLLVRHILDPLRYAAGLPVVISSGYRNELVNDAVSGDPHSQHLEGLAADLGIPGMSPEHVADLIEDLGLPYDQLITYVNSDHVHVSYSDRPRRQRLRLVA